MYIYGENKGMPAASKKSFASRLAALFTGKRKERKRIRDFSDADKELLECLKQAKSEWLAACSNYEFAEDQDEVDYYVYKIKACQIKYECYIKKAKQRGLRLDPYVSVHENQSVSREIST